MTGDGPRLIVNEGGSWSTNLLYDVMFKAETPDARAVYAAMLSSVTALMTTSKAVHTVAAS